MENTIKCVNSVTSVFTNTINLMDSIFQYELNLVAKQIFNGF